MTPAPGNVDLTQTHVANHTKIEALSLDEKAQQAAIRDWFLEKDNGVIKSVLQNDLWPFADIQDVHKMRFVTVDEFLPAFLNNLLHVYDSEPVLKFADGAKTESVERLRDLLDEADFFESLRATLIQARLHNTTITGVHHNVELNRMFIQAGYNVGNSWVETFEGFMLEWEVFAYEVGRKGKQFEWVVWDRGAPDGPEHYVFVTKERFPQLQRDNKARLINGTKKPIKGNEDFMAPVFGDADKSNAPFITYRYERHNDFWGNGMDAVVELVRIVNLLLTITGDDTIQETIRLLILNFDPTGTKGDQGQIKTGLRNPVMVTDAAAGGPAQDPKGTIVSADLYNEEILKLIESLLDITTSMYNVDNPIRRRVQQELSGIALRLRAEPTMQNWAKDIRRVRKPDMRLLKSLIEVNNHARPDSQIDVQVLDGLVLDYMEPNISRDEESEFKAEQERWQHGLSNPLLWVLRTNPEMSEKDARKFIEDNQKITRELKGQPLNLTSATTQAARSDAPSGS